MSLQEDKKKLVLKNVLRLVRKNMGTLHIVASAAKGILTGNFSKSLLSKVFNFDPRSKLPVEDLVAESLLSGLSEEDIEDIFRKYAKRKGLEF